jgi:UrcA family protein
MLNKSAFTSILIATTFGLAFAHQVAAEPMSHGTTLSKTVRYSDLDISSEAGARSLLSRIRRAANYVCSGGDWVIQMNRGAAFQACVQRSSSRAVAELGNPVVTAMYDGSAIRLATK